MERIRLILHLNSNFFQKHWECQSFSEFLTSKCTNDEIYFYLSCRDWLNKGLALTNQKNSFEIVQREEAKRTLEVVRKILSRFDDRDANLIIEKLSYSSIGKSTGKEYLDIGFVLKILMELYRADKKARYLFLKHDLDVEERLFSMIPRHSLVASGEVKTHEFLTSFENFRKFIDKHFGFLSETEKLQLYCDSYNIGGGEITFDALFTILHEYGVFIKDMRVRYLSLDSLSKSKTSGKDLIEPVEQDINLSFIKKLKDNRPKEYQIHDLLASKIESFGIEKLAFDIKSSEGWLDGTRFGYGWQDIFLMYTKVMNLRCLVNTASLINIKHPADSQYLVNLMIAQSSSYLDVFQASVDVKTFEEHQRNLEEWAVRRMSTFTKKRLDKANWYRLMHLILDWKEVDLKKSEKPLLQRRKTTMNLNFK